MNIRRHLPVCLGLYLLTGFLPAIAQIPAVKPDSLHPGQDKGHREQRRVRRRRHHLARKRRRRLRQL